jgi:DNA-directed RNA polymerase subunit RPC12/RpoP
MSIDKLIENIQEDIKKLKENRKSKCSCGSTTFYGEKINDEWYVCCTNCNNKWLAKRKEDSLLPELSKVEVG